MYGFVGLCGAVPLLRCKALEELRAEVLPPIFSCVVALAAAQALKSAADCGKDGDAPGEGAERRLPPEEDAPGGHLMSSSSRSSQSSVINPDMRSARPDKSLDALMSSVRICARISADIALATTQPTVKRPSLVTVRATLYSV